jgi:hypothetical protein
MRNVIVSNGPYSLDIHFSADVLPSKPGNNILTLHVRAVSTNYVCDNLET